MLRFCVVILSILTGMPAVPARADVATDEYRDGPVSLYYADGGRIVRSLCQDGGFFDRARCTDWPQDVGAAALIKLTTEGAGDGVDGREQQLSDLHVAIARIDQKLLELLSTAPQPTPDMAQAWRALETQVAAQDGVIADLNDQLARIDQQLAHGDDAELRAQRLITEAARNAALTARDALKERLDQARFDYVNSLGAAASDTTFQGLVQQRAEKRVLADKARAALAALIERQAAAQRLVSMLREEQTTYELRNGSAAFPGELKWTEPLRKAFDRIIVLEAQDAAAALEARKVAYDAAFVRPLFAAARKRTWSRCHAENGLPACAADLSLYFRPSSVEPIDSRSVVGITFDSPMRRVGSFNLDQKLQNDAPCSIAAKAGGALRYECDGGDMSNYNVHAGPREWEYRIRTSLEGPDTAHVTYREDWWAEGAMHAYDCAMACTLDP